MKPLKRLNKNFYRQDTFKLAQSLLGKLIVRKYGHNTLIGKIVETEAYYGPKDLASHASRGKTPRTQLMFDQAGLAYIYLIYGMYYCFNIVTEAKDFPAAILIRAIEPIEGIKQMYRNRYCHGELSRTMTPTCHPSTKLRMTNNLTNGPAKFCQAFKIDKTLNGINLITGQKLYLTEDEKIKLNPNQIKKAKRIGIDYAGAYKNKPWRYYLKNNQFISKK